VAADASKANSTRKIVWRWGGKSENEKGERWGTCNVQDIKPEISCSGARKDRIWGTRTYSTRNILVGMGGLGEIEPGAQMEGRPGLRFVGRRTGDRGKKEKIKRGKKLSAKVLDLNGAGFWTSASRKGGDGSFGRERGRVGTK